MGTITPREYSPRNPLVVPPLEGLSAILTQPSVLPLGGRALGLGYGHSPSWPMRSSHRRAVDIIIDTSCTRPAQAKEMRRQDSNPIPVPYT